MRVVNLVSRFLKRAIFSLLELLVQLLLVATILATKLEDFFRRLRIREVDRRCAVELNVLCGKFLAGWEHVAMDVEDLQSEAARLRYAIFHTRITRLGGVAGSDWILAALGE